MLKRVVEDRINNQKLRRQEKEDTYSDAVCSAGLYHGTEQMIQKNESALINIEKERGTFFSTSKPDMHHKVKIISFVYLQNQSLFKNGRV